MNWSPPARGTLRCRLLAIGLGIAVIVFVITAGHVISCHSCFYRSAFSHLGTGGGGGELSPSAPSRAYARLSNPPTAESRARHAPTRPVHAALAKSDGTVCRFAVLP
jgi:hypothetical protein